MAEYREDLDVEGALTRRMQLSTAYLVVLPTVPTLILAALLGNFMLVIPTVFALVFVVLWRVGVARQQSAAKSNLANETTQLEVTEERIVWVQPTMTISLHWSRIQKWAETSTHFWLFENGTVARLVPKSALNQTEIQTIRASCAELETTRV